MKLCVTVFWLQHRGQQLFGAEHRPDEGASSTVAVWSYRSSVLQCWTTQQRPCLSTAGACVLMNGHYSSMNVETPECELQLFFWTYTSLFFLILSRTSKPSTFISHLYLHLLEFSRIFSPFFSCLHSISGSLPLPHPATVAPSSG